MANGSAPDDAAMGETPAVDEPEDSYEGDGADSDDESEGPDSSGQ
jgi:hypothetical protein